MAAVSPKRQEPSTPRPTTSDHELPFFRSIRAGRIAIFGVVNVTPDSFSDGGRYVDPDRAAARAVELEGDGADAIDVGGESTRPGADPVSTKVERQRVVPAIEAIRSVSSLPISIDTTKGEVAAAAIDAGASIVNDVSGGDDPDLLHVAAERRVDVILMHRRGSPKTMQASPAYDDVVQEVRAELASRAEAALGVGISDEAIALDPGIGFGKTLEHNLLLLRHLRELRTLGFLVAVGVSRKSFLGEILGLPVGERVEGTVAASLLAAAEGAQILRVHDARSMARALRVAEAVWGVGAR